MALGNGVLMRGPHFWALARADGTIIEGRGHTLLTKHRWLRTPVLRSLVAFAEMMSLAIVVHRRNGAWRGASLLFWLLLCLAVELGLSYVLPLVIASPVLGYMLLGLLSLAFGLLALRQGLGKTVWRYHGAEHKAVNAYEGGADLSDTEAVMTYSRVHDRCGTNLMVIMFLVLVLGYLPIGGALGEMVFAIVVSLELFRLVTRRPRSRVSRVVLAGGRTLQRYITTREPAREHLDVACTALGRVLDLEKGA
jgi:L-lactate permease